MLDHFLTLSLGLGAALGSSRLSVPSQPGPALVEVGQQAAPAAGHLSQVAVIGASASAGFLLPSNLSRAIEQLLVAEHRPVLHTADSRFFLAPRGYGEWQVTRAVGSDATLVLAVDYLFWFGYGHVRSEDSRLEQLEFGLSQLERFECPVLTSTLPDMSAALGKMLWPGQVPEPATLQKLNERIEAWAAERDNVVLLSLPDLLARLKAGEPQVIGGSAWPEESNARLLLWDELHPNVEGLALLACKALERLQEAGVVDAESIDLDPERVAGPLRARLEKIVAPR